MLDWLIHSDRPECMHVDFEPDLSIPLWHDKFNLFFGFKIEVMDNITSYDDNVGMGEPFII